MPWQPCCCGCDALFDWGETVYCTITGIQLETIGAHCETWFDGQVVTLTRTGANWYGEKVVPYFSGTAVIRVGFTGCGINLDLATGAGPTPVGGCQGSSGASAFDYSVPYIAFPNLATTGGQTYNLTITK